MTGTGPASTALSALLLAQMEPQTAQAREEDVVARRDALTAIARTADLYDAATIDALVEALVGHQLDEREVYAWRALVQEFAHSRRADVSRSMTVRIRLRLLVPDAR